MNNVLPKILIVDDLPANISAMRKILSKVEAKLFEAESGEDALALCAEHDFALALLDVNMPKMNGFQLAEILYGVKRTKGLPIIFVTAAEADAYQILQGYQVGAVDFVRKPIDNRILLSKVGVFLELNNKRRTIEESALLLQEKNQQLEYEIDQRHQAEDKISRAYESRIAISKLLQTALDPISLEEQLDTVLDILFSVPWLSLQKKGGVFLVDQETEDLVLSCSRGFSDEQLEFCSRLKPGVCLCGKALEKKQIIFSSSSDPDHEIKYEGGVPHAHYCIPLLTSDQVFGVLTLYMEDGHKPIPEESEFLTSASNTIVGLIERRSLERQLKQQAQFDELTGLPNRVLFHDRLNQSIKFAKRTGKDVVLMFLDLDRFKLVNDTMGHEAGDILLQEAAKRISSCVRDSDTVARLGGDEFTVILPQLTHPFYVELVTRKILEQLETPFNLPQGEALVSGSIGVTVFPNDAEDAEELIKHADSAMYQAKTAGRSTFRFYTKEMNTFMSERYKLEADLRKGISEGEMVLYYQPKLNLTTGAVNGMEALVRWKREDIGIVMPADFIPLAEDTKLIEFLDMWVLENACRQNKIWNEMGYSGLVVSVNISTLQFRRGADLVDTITAILNKTGMPPELLELEITESMLMENVDQAVVTMESIRDMGVQISLDDFGTGYSSLSALKRFPLQTLKIDRSFVMELTEDSDDQEIVSAIISLAQKLKLNVVAEGVETAQQLKFLQEHFCNYVQGFFYSEPVSVVEFEKLLQEKKGAIEGLK
ncbi:MAG: EAL domain-containing protein [Magnetococcales bacterium]|nr:EAL domain-containing protein [Magnetococcales bacterium]